MSHDLYLLPLKPTDDFAAAMALLDRLNAGGAEAAAGTTDVRTAAAVLQALEPEYKAFAMNFEAIARLERITPEEARAKYNHIELNHADSDTPYAQFVFYPTHVVIHWYSATTQKDMGRYLQAIIGHTGLALVDPQASRVLRLNANGKFS